MDRTKAASVIQRFLTCGDICRDGCSDYCEICRYNTEYDEETEALKLAIAALEGKDTNVPTTWIPVSRGLPEDNTEVIVSCIDDSGDSEYSYTTTGWHFKGIWVVDNEINYFVRAWIPLPEPWKGEKYE